MAVRSVKSRQLSYAEYGVGFSNQKGLTRKLLCWKCVNDV